MNTPLSLNAYKWKVDTSEELLDRISNAAARSKKREDQTEQHAIFAHELQSALRLTGF